MKSGCYSGICGNNDILKKIKAIVNVLEHKMFAFPLVMKFEGKNCTKLVTKTKIKHSVPGKKITKIISRINESEFSRNQRCDNQQFDQRFPRIEPNNWAKNKKKSGN